MNEEVQRILLTIDNSKLDCGDDWGDVVEQIMILSHKWKMIGRNLHVKPDIIKQISANYPQDHHTCLGECVGEWLKGNYNTDRFGEPSWRRLAEVVAKLDRDLFKIIADAHKIDESSMEIGKAVGKSVFPNPVQAKLDMGITASYLVSDKTSLPQMSSCGSKLRIIPVDSAVLTFPSLVLKNLNAAQRLQLEARLYSESVDMMFKFQGLVSTIRQSLKERAVPIQDIVSQLYFLKNLNPVYGHSEYGQYRENLKEARTVDDLFWIISDYCSFFNFEVIEHLINKLGTDNDKDELEKYKRMFDEYAKRKVYECPSEFATMKENQAKVFITLDDSYNECSLSHLKILHHKLCKVLGVSEKGMLQLCRVEPGSLKLTLLLPLSAYNVVFPLSPEQEADLRKLDTLTLSCGAYQLPMDYELHDRDVIDYDGKIDSSIDQEEIPRTEGDHQKFQKSGLPETEGAKSVIIHDKDIPVSDSVSMKMMACNVGVRTLISTCNGSE